MNRLAAYGELIDVLDNLGTLVREARRTRRHSTRETGRLTGVSNATVSRIERGEGFDSRTAVALLRYLDPESAPTPKQPEPPQAERLPIEGDTDDTTDA